MNRVKIKKFETILHAQLEELFRGAIQVADDTILSDEKGKLDNVDLASLEIDWINSLRIKDRERNLMLKIKQALTRIEKGSFGICDSCGEEINEKRLLARPVTTHCVECKEIAEENEQRKGL